VRTTHIHVWFGTRNFGVAPAGTTKANTGHHHLLIDTALPPLDQPIPERQETTCTSASARPRHLLICHRARNTLQILMGDGDHIPHDPPLMSKKITIRCPRGGSTGGGGATELTDYSRSRATRKPLTM